VKSRVEFTLTLTERGWARTALCLHRACSKFKWRPLSCWEEVKSLGSNWQHFVIGVLGYQRVPYNMPKFRGHTIA